MTKQAARNQGFNAVASRPFVAPENPFDEDTQTELHDAWEDGAIEAGVCDIYESGILIPSMRK